jgi:hypothetical protein
VASFSLKNNFFLAALPTQEMGILLHEATCDLPNLILTSHHK